MTKTRFPRLNPRTGAAAAALLLLLPAAALAQAWPRILEGAELERVVPPGFYFEGQSAATQMRNTAAVQFGPNRFAMAGLVDTSGYSSDVQAKYQGFLITDSPVFVEGARSAFGLGLGDEADDGLGVRAADEEPAFGRRHLHAVAQVNGPVSVRLPYRPQGRAHAVGAARELLLQHV